MAIKIVFLGSKPIGYDCLQELISRASGLGIEICGLRTHIRQEFSGQKNLADLATRHQIPLLDSLDELPECDIIYSVQHHELLMERHIRKAGQIAVNLHLAPLPEYRGCNQFSFAIMDEASQFGVTIHKMDARIDHGAILFERRFPVPDACWIKELYDQTVKEALNLFRDTLERLISGDYTLRSQDQIVAKRSLHFRSEIGDLKLIDLNLPAREIEKRIRATAMPGFEPPYCQIGAKRVYLNTEDARLRYPEKG